jgi:DNA-binding NarL/FixJ family response regulator
MFKTSLELNLPFLTRREKEVLEKMGSDGRGSAFVPAALGIQRATVNSHLTKIFVKYLEALETVSEYDGVFDGRMKKHADVILKQFRKQRSMMK